MNPYADLASLSYRDRMLLVQAPKKFCGSIGAHPAHGWVCARKQVRCEGITAVGERAEDPISLVRDLARGAYAPKPKGR